MFIFFFSSRRRHTRYWRDWSSDVCSSDLDSAAESYDGDEQRANQVAWAAVKHSHEKVGDHWEPKEGGRKGPSDPQAAGGRDTDRPTKGGVDGNATKAHLLDVAKRLDISGRSRMRKEIGRASCRERV